ncbi:MAG: hypothetical protein JJU40_07850 [Rhodobacteraceae bacterium]|nr:hypothetical protein [Paracoccaceae bacterium]
MRAQGLALVILFASAVPGGAWDFSPSPVCTLTHEAEWGSLRVTFDPGQDEPYRIALTRAVPWPGGPAFAILFEGARGFTIATNRHRLSGDGRTLTVTDRGFGNVLDGLEFNERAHATLGDVALPVSLDGAAEPVRAFRACPEVPAA